MFNIVGFCNHTCIQLETIAKAVLNFTNIECPTPSNTDDNIVFGVAIDILLPEVRFLTRHGMSTL